MTITVHEIGTISVSRGFELLVHKDFAQGLSGLEGFSHLMILWYADKTPKWDKEALLIDKPYRLAPEKLGVFSTRSPYRPNNLCVSVAAIKSLNIQEGRIELDWTDAEEGSPVLDIKPYYQCSENVASANYPDWCAHWPSSYEKNSDFDWQKEFLFTH